MRCKEGLCAKKEEKCCLLCNMLDDCIQEWIRACNDTGEMPSICSKFDLINNPLECNSFEG